MVLLHSRLLTVCVILCCLSSRSTALGTRSSRRRVASKSKQLCNAIGKCEMCTSDDLRTNTACKATGRRQRVSCAFDGRSNNEASGGKETNEVYQSCKRTESDDEFSMIRFQVFCFLLGSMALASAKKQMRLSSSLFDQRKRGQQPTSRRQTDQREDEVEMSRFEEETRRLVWNTSNPLEVI